MTEKEKMLAGQLYDCADATLLAQWHKAKDLVNSFEFCKTQTAPVTIGDHVWIGSCAFPVMI